MSKLPINWVSAPLGTLGQWGSGGTPKRTNPAYYEGGRIPWLIIGDLNDNVVTHSTTHITEAGLANSSAKLLPPDTLLVAMYGSIGKLGITGIDCTTNQAIAFCKPDNKIVLLRYLYYSLMNAKNDLLALGQGGAQQNISQAILKAYNISVAPLNEQQRIVDKLDSLLDRTNVCRDRLDRIPAILISLRHSILAEAVTGRLTTDLRNKTEYQTTKFGWEIPESWKLVTINEVAEVKGGKRLPNGKALVSYDTGYPYIRAGQLKNGTVMPDGQLYLTEDVRLQIARYIVNSGDVYITIVGAKIGDAGVIPEKYNGANLTENAAKLCNLKNNISNSFLSFWLRSQLLQEIIHFEIKSGAQGKLALMRIKTLPLPLPSIEEQTEIVNRIETLFAYVDRLEARYANARTQIEKIGPTSLVKAFRGELVPQDPSDKPARDLLARIAEHNSVKTKIKSTKESF